MNRIRMLFVILLLAFSTGAFAQGSIPSGTILPIRLNTAISTKAHGGEIITGRVMQDVPLADGRRIREGAEVVGHVIAVRHADGGEGTQVSFSFDKLIVSKETTQVTTYLRAIASPVEVEDAQLPETAPEGVSQDAWTTVQVGGDVVYRGGGPVKEGSQTVGMPVYGGVLDRVYPLPGCSDQGEDNGLPQALWVFSADACGAYGFPAISIKHAGRRNPVGEISVGSNGTRLNIPSGAGMLLRVASAGKATA